MTYAVYNTMVNTIERFMLHFVESLTKLGFRFLSRFVLQKNFAKNVIYRYMIVKNIQ